MFVKHYCLKKLLSLIHIYTKLIMNCISSFCNFIIGKKESLVVSFSSIHFSIFFFRQVKRQPDRWTDRHLLHFSISSLFSSYSCTCCLNYSTMLFEHWNSLHVELWFNLRLMNKHVHLFFYVQCKHFIILKFISFLSA